MNEYNPDKVTPPYETILETMEAKSLDRETFGLLMIPLFRQYQTESLLRGEMVITQEIAVQLEAALDVPAQFWLNRQKRFEESL